jgi:FkbM family methyltransferase
MLSSHLFQLASVRGHTFIPAPLDVSAVVVDLGANRAEFSRAVAERFGCRCVAIEANPEFVKSATPARNVELAWRAISDQEGSSDFYLSDNLEASTLFAEGAELNGKKVVVPTSTLESVLKKYGISHVDLLKVDIEGAEIPLLLSTPDYVMRSIDQISVEFHDFCDLVSAEQIASVKARLAALNFDEINLATGDKKWSNLNCLFVRRDAPRIGLFRRLYLKNAVIHVRRAAHFMRSVKSQRAARRLNA